MGHKEKNIFTSTCFTLIFCTRTFLIYFIYNYLCCPSVQYSRKKVIAVLLAKAKLFILVLCNVMLKFTKNRKKINFTKKMWGFFEFALCTHHSLFLVLCSRTLVVVVASVVNRRRRMPIRIRISMLMPIRIRIGHLASIWCRSSCGSYPKFHKCWKIRFFYC
jgi:hypothetical protein